MDKHTKELAILEKLERSSYDHSIAYCSYRAIKTMFYGTFCSWFLNVISESLAAAICCEAVFAVIAVILLKQDFQANRTLKDMYPQLCVSDDEQMEELLQSSHMVNENIFISSKYYMNFESFIVFKLSDIKKIKKCDVSEDTYEIRIKPVSGRTEKVSFVSPNERNAVYKDLITCIGILDDQKDSD